MKGGIEVLKCYSHRSANRSLRRDVPLKQEIRIPRETNGQCEILRSIMPRQIELWS
jgi:hypothetical protein